MSKHSLGDSPSGLWRVVYNADAENVTLYAERAKGWKYLLDGEGTLAHFREVAEAFTSEATAEDLRWLADTIASVETWLETCPHDLARFGQVGVSY